MVHGCMRCAMRRRDRESWVDKLDRPSSRRAGPGDGCASTGPWPCPWPTRQMKRDGGGGNDGDSDGDRKVQSPSPSPPRLLAPLGDLGELGLVADISTASPPPRVSPPSPPPRPRPRLRSSAAPSSSRPRSSPVAVARDTSRTASRVVCTWLRSESGQRPLGRLARRGRVGFELLWQAGNYGKWRRAASGRPSSWPEEGRLASAPARLCISETLALCHLGSLRVPSPVGAGRAEWRVE